MYVSVCARISNYKYTKRNSLAQIVFYENIEDIKIFRTLKEIKKRKNVGVLGNLSFEILL